MNKAGRRILKRLMRNYKDQFGRVYFQKDQVIMRCPFHGEKTPSFKVNTKDGRYHCFGCMMTGDIYTLARTEPHLLGRSIFTPGYRRLYKPSRF